MVLKAIRDSQHWAHLHPARAGSLAGLFNQACTISVAILLIPITTSYLPAAEAGLWFSLQGLVAMVAMMDLGFGFAISRQAAFTLGNTREVNATDDFIQLAPGISGTYQLFGLTRRLYLILSAAAVVLCIIAYEVFSRVGNLIPPHAEGTRLAWYCIALASVISIFSGGYAAFLNGIGAVYQTRILAGLAQLGAGVGAGVAACCGGGLPMMAASFAASTLLYAFAVSYLLRRKMPPLAASEARLPPPGSLRALARAALPIGMVNVFGSLVFMVQAPLLGMLLGPEKVVPFYLAQKIGLAFNMMSMQLALPQLPFFTRALGNKNWGEVRSRLKATIQKTHLIVLISSLAYFFLSPWMALVLLRKNEYVDSSVLLIMALDFCILGITGLGGQFVLASGKNPFVFSTIFTGITSFSLVILLTPRLGIIALPISTLVAGLVFNYRKCFMEYRKMLLYHTNQVSAKS